MGFFSKARDNYRKISDVANKLSFLSQYTNLPDVGNSVVVGDWIIFRGEDGKTYRYITEGAPPLYVEHRAQSTYDDAVALVCSYESSKDADTRYAIARGTNDMIDAWFKVGDDFGAEYVAMADNGTAVFYDDGNEKLHMIDPDGKHKTRSIEGCDDYAGNKQGFYWWQSNDREVSAKGFILNPGIQVSKKIKGKKNDYIDDVELKEDGLHVVFADYETGEATEYLFDFQGNASKLD